MLRRIVWATVVVGLAAPATRAQSDAVEAEQARARAEREQDRVEREQARAEAEQDRAEAERDRADARYERAMDLVDDSRWQEAVAAFDAVVREKDARADAALYWQAYAQMKQGRAQEAVAKIQALRAGHPKSRWIKEAGALELEIKGRAGQPPQPESIEDEELKLIAIQNLMTMDPQQALPLLRKVLDNPKSSPKLKEKALFVLSQSGSPEAREILVRAAKGDGYPGLQRKAIQNLGIFGGGENAAALAEIYAASAEREVKRAVLQAYLVSGQRDRLMALAKAEADASLRRDAIHQLGAMGASDQLWAMYASGDRETKRAIQQALFVGGNGPRLVELARTEKDPELRRDAIRQLGLVGSAETSAAMEEIYRTETDRGVREAVLQGFFVQGNAKRLIEIAKTEKDPEMRRRAVQHLSVMGHPEATRYMLEILEK